MAVPRTYSLSNVFFRRFTLETASSFPTWKLVVDGLPPGPPPQTGGGCPHPPVLDGAIQLLLAQAHHQHHPGGAPPPLLLPSRLARCTVRVGLPAGGPARATATVHHTTGREAVGDVGVSYSGAGHRIQLEGLAVRWAGAAQDSTVPAAASLYRTVWTTCQLLPYPMASAGRWLVVAEAGHALGPSVVGRLPGAVLCTGDPRASVMGGGWTGVLVLTALHPDTSAEAALAVALHTVQAVAQGGRPAPSVMLVTRGSQAVGCGAVEPTHAGLWGFARCVRAEQPDLPLRCLDLGEADAAAEVERIVAELLLEPSDQHPTPDAVVRGPCSGLGFIHSEGDAVTL